MKVFCPDELLYAKFLSYKNFCCDLLFLYTINLREFWQMYTLYFLKSFRQIARFLFFTKAARGKRRVLENLTKIKKLVYTLDR